MGESQMASKDMIDLFMSQVSTSRYITGNYLESLCNSQILYVPNIPALTLGGKTAWKTLLDCEGWRVQANKITHHIRILDSQNVRKAWGSTEQILSPISSYVYTQEKIKELKAKDELNLGIVFCGGGAKGAYQIGVWKRLREMRISQRFTGISGASVGALNALLFAQGDYEKATDAWKSIHDSDLKQPNPDLLKLLLRAVGAAGLTKLAMPIGAAALGSAILVPELRVSLNPPFEAEPDRQTALPTLLDSWQKSLGLLSREKLKSTIDRFVSKNAILQTNKLIFVSLTALSAPHVPSENHRVREIVTHGEYHCLGGISFKQCVDKAMASAALPGAYSPIKIEGKVYIDGGVLDNSPALPLAVAGYKAILVVHLSTYEEAGGTEQRMMEQNLADLGYGHTKIFHIWPNKPLGGLLEISEEKTEERISAGYDDAYEQLDHICQQLKWLGFAL